MKRSLDRPMPYTLNSLYLQRATPANQQARVWFKDFAPKGTPAGKYLMPQVHGGERSDKRFERSLQRAGYLQRGKQLVPASGIRSRLDSSTATCRAASTRKSCRSCALGRPVSERDRRLDKRRRRSRGGPQYFYGNPNGRGRGVWLRMPGGRVLGGRLSGSLTPIFLEQSPHHYSSDSPSSTSQSGPPARRTQMSSKQRRRKPSNQRGEDMHPDNAKAADCARLDA
jgi:hypothetical protein